MVYKDFDSNYTYVVMHQQGLGVMESPIQDVEILFETDDLAEAEKKAKKFSKIYVSDKQRKSGWVNDHFTIYTNTSTEEGKELLEEWKKEFKKEWEAAQSNSNFIAYQMENGTKVLIEHNELFDGPKPKEDGA